MATMRVTSKDLGFMIALQSRYEVKYKRLPKRHWWWLKPRYEIHIQIPEGFGSPEDFWIRFAVINLARRKACYHFGLEVTDGKEYEKVV